MQITVAETLGVEGRAGYYDTAGALRDMVQNHILQLLCLVAMEPPTSIEADAVRDEKLKVLQGAEADHRAMTWRNLTVRGQYRAGASANGGAVPGYLEELGSTYLQDRNLRRPEGRNRQLALDWRAVLSSHRQAPASRASPRSSSSSSPFRIRSSMHSAGPISSNRLVIRLQPDEGVKLWLMIKDPGPGGMRLRHVPLDMSFAEAFDVRNPDAYERLLMDVVRGNQTLFMRRDEVEAAWTWIDPILDDWKASPDAAQALYRRHLGATAAVALIERDGRTWHEGDAA